ATREREGGREGAGEVDEADVDVQRRGGLVGVDPLAIVDAGVHRAAERVGDEGLAEVARDVDRDAIAGQVEEEDGVRALPDRLMAVAAAGPLRHHPADRVVRRQPEGLPEGRRLPEEAEPRIADALGRRYVDEVLVAGRQ